MKETSGPYGGKKRNIHISLKKNIFWKTHSVRDCKIVLIHWVCSDFLSHINIRNEVISVM